MKKLVLFVFLFASFQAFGQFPNYTNINGRYKWIAGKFDSTFTIPSGTTPSLRTGGGTGPGALFYRTTDSTVYQYTGTQWIKLRAGVSPTDTAGIWISNVYRKTGTDSVYYIKGGTSTFAFRDSIGNVGGGGGGGKIYYFNGGVNLGTFAGITMYELGDTAVTSAAANFTRSTTGNLANFITDVNRPGLLQIPAGAWTVDAYLSETGGGANHAEIWIEVEKWDGSTITTIATSQIEQITNGSVIDLYTWSVSIPTTTLAVTDRIIIQFYITNTNGKTVTLYTQNGYVGEVHTTFTTGIGSLNGLTAPTQYFATGTSGTDFAISSSTATHTFNLPTASGSNRGALSSADWTTFNGKVGGSGTTNYVSKFTASGTIGNSQIFDDGTNVGIGLTSPTNALQIDKGTGVASYLQFTSGTLTGQLATDGFEVGIDASGNAVINQQENLPMLFYTNNTERMRILQGGNVGIGTISPSSTLELYKSSGTNYLYITNAAASSNNGVVLRYLGVDYMGMIGNFFTGELKIGGFNASTFFPTFYSNNAERMRLTPSGRLLIGTTTESTYILDVSGTTRLNGNVTIGVSTLTLSNTEGSQVLRITAPIGIQISSDKWISNVSSSSYIQNGYSTKSFVITPTANANYNAFDFSASSAFNPTLSINYNQKLINGAMTINSTGIANFFGLDSRTTDNSASIANNVYAIYADATLGTNTSATRWAGYFVGRIANTLGATFATSSGNVLIGTTTDAGYKLDVNGTFRVQTNGSLLANTTISNLRVGSGAVGFTGLEVAASSRFTGGTDYRFLSNGGGQFVLFVDAVNQSVGVGNNSTLNASAVLDLTSTTKGFLPPRMTGAQAELIGTPAAGLMVYSTDGSGATITSLGWWGYNGTTWVKLN